MRYYVSIFPNSKVINVWQAGDKVIGVSFILNGQEVRALNGGPQFTFKESFPFFVDCASQEEVDQLWSKLTADGGQEGQCGWLKDKYGLSWQIIPVQLGQLMNVPDPAQASRVTQALLKMKKIVIADLEQAAKQS